MHVLHVIDSLGLGGAERVLVDLANRTVVDGHRASVCVTRTDTRRATELDPRVRLLVLGRTRRVSISAVRTLARWIRSNQVDVIHAHMRSTAANMLALRALRIVRAPIIFHDHYGSIELDRSVPRWFRLVHRYASLYVGVSDALRDWARAAGVPAERSITIGNAIDLAAFQAPRPAQLREELGIDGPVPLAIVVATLRRDKGIDVLLDALAQMRNQGVRVAIAGADGEPAYAAECRRRAGARVMFLGARSDVPALLHAADIGVLASRTESGPLVLAEYVAAGLPVVSTRVGNIGQRLAELGVQGFVPADNVGALASALDEVLDLTPEQRRSRGEAGRRLLGDAWDVRNVMSRWYEVYRDVVARN
jgi:glycosyltransferase involved in cell wall biosynthesis